MKKPWENRDRLTDGRRTRSPQNGKFVACLGSFEQPAMIQTTEDRTKGSCPVCGKWCVLRDAYIPRHKEMSHVVQGWEVHG